MLDVAEAAALVGADDDLEAIATTLVSRARDQFGASAGMTALAAIGDRPEPATGRYQGTLVLAADLAGRVATRCHGFASTRADLRRRAILLGAEFLRLELLGDERRS